MIHVEIIAPGKMRDKSQLGLWADYVRRMQWNVTMHEIDAKKPGDEESKTLEKIDNQAYVIALDERGKTIASVPFAKKIEDIAAGGISKIQFVIGGADGLGDTVRNKADFLLSFGAQTWPHMLVRIMLIEQIYRAQQILAGHPYHRE